MVNEIILRWTLLILVLEVGIMYYETDQSPSWFMIIHTLLPSTMYNNSLLLVQIQMCCSLTSSRSRSLYAACHAAVFCSCRRHDSVYETLSTRLFWILLARLYTELFHQRCLGTADGPDRQVLVRSCCGLQFSYSMLLYTRCVGFMWPLRNYLSPTI